MRRFLMIALSLALALAGWSTVGADDGFYVVPMKMKVPKTGQTTSYGPRDDGALQKGGTWPIPRFTDNGNGTVTDNLTSLIWMKNANAFAQCIWTAALTIANGLKSGDADLTDGSKAGDWRLPNVRELQSLVDYSKWNPALPEGHPFTEVRSLAYWTSTTYVFNNSSVWWVYFATGDVTTMSKTGAAYVWCVRGGP
jgi:hypothetical protein